MNEKNPWKKLSSEVVYQNPWITVREDQVIRPDGAAGIYGVVETRVAVGVLALTADQELYLVGQYRYPLDAYSWEIIEGGTDEGETALETAQRELREEAGLLAQDWSRLGGDIHLSNCYSSEVGVLYVARDLQEVESAPDGTEVLEIRREPFQRCVEMVLAGEIQDGLSIIGILRAARVLGV